MRPLKRYLGIFILIVLTLVILAMQAVMARPNPKLTRGTFKELTEINTTNSIGSTTNAAVAVAARLKAVGYRPN